jgi:hypothetical protein
LKPAPHLVGYARVSTDEWTTTLRESGVASGSLTEHIDAGRLLDEMLYPVLSAVAQFERTVAGMQEPRDTRRPTRMRVFI